MSLTLGLVGLIFVLEVLGFEGASWRSLTRPVMTTILTILLVLAMVTTSYVDWLRDFYDFRPVGPGGWAIVIVATVAAITGQFLITRNWNQIIAFIAAAPRMGEDLRGRGN